MQVGDGVLFYHSSCDVPGIVGTATVASKPYPDPTQFDPKSDYYDPKSTREQPRWELVDVAFERKLKRTIALDEIKQHADRLGEGFALIRRGIAPVGVAGDGGAMETPPFPGMNTDTMSEAKRLAGEKAIDYVEDGMIVGVGTGSTVAFFIDALARIKDRIKGAVSSSEQSTQRLRAHGIEVLDLNSTGPLSLYVDGADECDPHKRLIKGGGAALTREKIIAEASEKFVCIIDPAKRVDVLGKFPLPVEVIPMARSLVAREILAMTGGQPVWRDGVVTDNGNVDPRHARPGHHRSGGAWNPRSTRFRASCRVGLFARRPADVVIVGGEPPLVF